MTRYVLAFIAILGVPTALGAQSLPTLGLGARVRVTDVQGRETIGDVGSSGADSLVILAEGHAPAVFRPEATSLVEVSRGRASNVLQTMLIVTGAGVAAGGILGGMTHEPCHECLIRFSRAESILLGAIVVGIASAPVGLITGLLTAEEGWRRVSPDVGGDGPAVSFRVAPEAGGAVRISGRIAPGSR
jgi:hypothetical protein